MEINSTTAAGKFHSYLAKKHKKYARGSWNTIVWRKKKNKVYGKKAKIHHNIIHMPRTNTVMKITVHNLSFLFPTKALLFDNKLNVSEFCVPFSFDC